jgi:hypothetical protein
VTLGGERGAVQDPFIRYAAEAGWRYHKETQTLPLRRRSRYETALREDDCAAPWRDAYQTCWCPAAGLWMLSCQSASSRLC